MSREQGWQEATKGMQLVLETEPSWKDRALDLIRTYTASLPRGARFSADNLRDFCEHKGLGEPHHPNAWGAVMRVARHQGYLTPTGDYRPSSRTSRHAGNIPIYRAGVE